MIGTIERATEYVAPLVEYCVGVFGRRGYWLIVLVGVSLTFVTEFYFFVHGLRTPVLHVLQLLLPMSVGIGLIWFGFRLDETEFTARQIGILSLSVVVGMGIFVVVAAYMHLIMALEGAVPSEKLYLLLNAMAIGAVVNVIYGYQYVRLEMVKDRARTRNDRLTRIASLVSHDLRNPLNVAQGHAELVDEKRTDEFKPVLEALDRIESLTDELLLVAQGGSREVSTVAVSLEEIARDAWDIVETKRADLDVAGDLAFEADADRLDHLFENLFRNAIEHGGDDVTVEVGPMDDGGFYVADDGPGIDPEDRDAVFDPGFSTAEDGTGLGLNIVGEIVDEHDWDVNIEESRRGGVRFNFDGVDGGDRRR
ncbi:MAG: sensor histidine kinase [Halanaeroarchaeum sp.]